MKSKHLVYTLAVATAFLWNDRITTAQQVLSRTDRLDQSTFNSNKQSSKFLRLIKDKAGVPESLQTSITRYRSTDGKLLIDLISVIHIGEREYYRKLDHQFTQYESLLYELVAPEHSRVPDRATESSGNPIRWLQDSMQGMLGLSSQLDHIDYKKRNFVHADLSPAEMKRKMEERGETAWSIGMKAIGEMMKQQEKANRNGAAGLGSEIASFDDLFKVLSDPAKLKTMMAIQFASGSALEAGLGKTLNQLLITDRNEAAIKVLEEELDKGKTKIGIFYGAAHMPNFEKRLVKEFGMRKTQQAWTKAWDLKSSPASASPASTLTEMFFKLMEELDE